MSWAARSLDDAIREAGERRVALKMGAAWCSMCDALDRAVLDTPAGAAIFEELVTVGADFDAPGGRALVEEFAILELPTVIVLERGEEVGRVVGFEDAGAWMEAARVAVSAADPVPAPRERCAAAPDDLGARVELGEALLSRAPEEALALLERASLEDGQPAARALWLLGRYRQRVCEDPGTARWIWRELAFRFPRSPHAVDAWWWFARAQAALGHPELGSAAYEALVAAGDGTERLLEWARFCARVGHEPARATIREAALRAMKAARGRDREALEELVMNLSAPFTTPM